VPVEQVANTLVGLLNSVVAPGPVTPTTPLSCAVALSPPSPPVMLARAVPPVAEDASEI
jgi:hypothetical protein